MNKSHVTERHTDTVGVITGGAQGVGFAIARQLVAEGCRKLILASRDRTKGERAAAELSALGCHARFVSLDLQNSKACLDLIDTAVREFGTITGLVNAAALAERGTLLDTPLETWDNIFFTNVRAPFFLMQGFVKHRLAHGGGGSPVLPIAAALVPVPVGNGRHFLDDHA